MMGSIDFSKVTTADTKEFAERLKRKTNLVSLVTAHIDTVAQSKGYTDGASMVSYTTSKVPGWKKEAQEFCAWRDDVWIHVHTMITEAEEGKRPWPSKAQALLELPVLSHPDK